MLKGILFLFFIFISSLHSWSVTEDGVLKLTEEEITAEELNLSFYMFNSEIGFGGKDPGTPWRRIKHLGRLGECRELKNLNLAGNEINPDELGQLSLNQLRVLDLASNNLTHLSFLRAFPNLRALALNGNPLIDISPLEGLESLEYLNMRFCGLRDIDPLFYLHKLEELFLDENKLRKIDTIASLKELRVLCLSKNKINKIGAVDWPELKKLHLAENRLIDIGFLSSCSKLSELYLCRNLLPKGSSPIDLSPLIRLIQANPEGIKFLYINGEYFISEQVSELSRLLPRICDQRPRLYF
ncbi:leucine-rich repeat domain-containing protein [Candidatus Babeliales bacterium]|nr:leucine-rich repeat domain-containing protein [Candidatus Babeliales bacterium]